MHLLPAQSIAEIRDMHSYRLEGTVSVAPKTLEGGHVIFAVRDREGAEIDCAAFEPTKKISERLSENWFLEIWFSFREVLLPEP